MPTAHRELLVSTYANTMSLYELYSIYVYVCSTIIVHNIFGLVAIADGHASELLAVLQSCGHAYAAELVGHTVCV